MFANVGRRLFPASCCTILISLVAAASAQAISLTVSWQGTSGNTVTGLLTGTDTNSNGVIDGAFGGSNEWTGTSYFTFTDNVTSATPVTYTISQLLGFGGYYGGSNGFRFNYNIVGGTVDQSGDPSTGVGLSIGDYSNGYILESSTSALAFTDNVSGTFSGSDNGGTLTATPVPFEFDASTGILTLGAIWGVNQWRKNRVKK